MKQYLNQQASLYVLTFFSSIVVSLFIYAQNDLINKDGILYLDIAQRYANEGIAGAYAAYDWPFYGILVGFVHQITTLSYEYSAYVLNSVLTAVTCTTFVAIYKEIGDEKTRPWLAALLILSLPVLNGYRDMVVRDFGFWAFSLIGLFHFIRFTRSGTIGRALTWQVAAIFAIAFRIEAVVFSAAPTLFYLASTGTVSDKLKNILKSSFLLFGLGAIGAAAVAAYGFISAGKRAYTLELWLSYISPMTLFDQLHAESAKLHQQLENLSSTSEAALVLGTGLVSLAVFKLVSNAVAPYLMISAYGSTKHWLHFGQHIKTVTVFLVLAFLPLLAVLFSQYFLSSRHTVLTVLLLSLLTFQYVDVAFQKLAALPRRRWWVIGWGFVIALFLDSVISSGSSKAIIKTGSQWALANVDQSKPWLCNETRLQFYTDGKCNYVDPALLLPTLQQNRVDLEPGYLLLWIGRKDRQLLQAIEGNANLLPINSRANRKGSRVVIFEIGPNPRD